MRLYVALAGGVTTMACEFHLEVNRCNVADGFNVHRVSFLCCPRQADADYRMLALIVLAIT